MIACSICGNKMDKNIRHSMLVLYHPFDDNVVWDLCGECKEDMEKAINMIFGIKGRSVKLDDN